MAYIGVNHGIFSVILTMAHKVVQTGDTLGEFFHKQFRALEPGAENADADFFYEILQKHGIETMPEDAGPFAFYDVGFGDGQKCLANTERPYNIYVTYNMAEEEYVFVRAGNLRGAEGCIKAAGAELRKLVSGSRKRQAA